MRRRPPRSTQSRTSAASDVCKSQSLDGVAAAVLVTDGHTITDFGPTLYRRYTDVALALT